VTEGITTHAGRGGSLTLVPWSECSGLVEPGGLLTVRAGREVCRLVGADGMSVAVVARRFGVSWAAAMAAVTRNDTPLVDDPAREERG
jgi:hypothetical protein